MESTNTLKGLNQYLANFYAEDLKTGNPDGSEAESPALLQMQPPDVSDDAVGDALPYSRPALKGFRPGLSKPVKAKAAAVHPLDKAQVVKLLRKITKDQPARPDKEFMVGALANFRDKKDVVGTKKLPSGEWKSSAVVTDTQEKIINKRSTLLPIGFLERGTEVAKAVVRLVVGNELGTGFMLDKGWLLTNNHVLPTAEAAAHARVEFGYQFPRDLKASEKTVTALFPDFTAHLAPGKTAGKGGFYTSAEDDWTLVKLAGADLKAAASYGFLTFSKKGAVVDDFANIIQHPLGGPKQISLYNNLIMYADENVVQYLNDTQVGSSGAPVFNVDWEVIALHHSGGWIKDPATNTLVFRNEGINIQKVQKVITRKKLFA